MEFLTLEEYLDGAKKMILSKCKFLINDEDAIAHVAHRMMLADQNWDGQASRSSWRYTQAKYAIMRILTKKKKERKLQSLDYGWDDEQCLTLAEKTPDTNHEDLAEKFSIVCNYADEILRGRQLECFDMYYKQHMTMQEIGDRLGISKQAVSLHVLQGTKELRKCLSQQDL